VLPVEPLEHTVRLRFAIESQIALDCVSLALEGMDSAVVLWNGAEIALEQAGYFVDRAIPVAPIGALKQGSNTLEVVLPFGRRTNLEWCYLLGDFGVRAAGRSAIITEPVRSLAFGDIACQGLPFYGGDVVYRITVPKHVQGGRIGLHVPHYRAPVLAVEAGGRRQGRIAFAPYNLEFERPADGNVDIVLFGSRVNAFGAVHMVSDRPRIIHPRAWRQEGDGWSDEYVFEAVGILSAPVITVM
jgi:hypothetical protein